MNPSRVTAQEIQTSQSGMRLATSVGGTLTGRGGNLIIIDDPIKPDDAMSEVEQESLRQWYDGTLYSRLNNKNTDVIILIMQRLQVDDLVKHVLAKENWTVLNLPAIATQDERIAIGPDRYHYRHKGDLLHPERENSATLENIRQIIGTMNFNAQYQQQPIPLEGNLIHWDWFNWYDPTLPHDEFEMVVQSWDPAFSVEENLDYSVCTTWGLRERNIICWTYSENVWNTLNYGARSL